MYTALVVVVVMVVVVVVVEWLRACGIHFVGHSTGRLFIVAHSILFSTRFYAGFYEDGSSFTIARMKYVYL